MQKEKQFKYHLYLASGITLWREYFSNKYSRFFNRSIGLFEPGTQDTPDDHRFIPIGIACLDLDAINHADALVVYMKKYKTLDGSPTGTDSTWECGYAISKSKPVIMLIEDVEHVDYYASQWMVSFSINAILTANKNVAEIVKNHQKFVHTTVLFAQNENQFESKISEYLDDYYRSIYSRSGIINYKVDERAREIANKESLGKMVFTNKLSDKQILKELQILKKIQFNSDKVSLLVCQVERNISKYFKNKLTEKEIDSGIAAVIESWDESPEKILNCLEHSINPPFTKVEGRHHGVKKVRPELFFELYDLVNHHLVLEKKFVKSISFPYDLGVVVELYNWMNTYALDDVFDNSSYRQKLETVWKKFTRRDAIYTGILGHLLTLKYFFIIASENLTIGKKLAGIMNECNLLMYRGQVIDLQLTFNSVSKKKLLKNKKFDEVIDLYIQRIYGICGGFFEAIGDLSARAGNKEAQILNANEINDIAPKIGMFYGIIQMIRNDLGDYVIVEEVTGMSKGMKGVSHSDIIEGKTDIAYLVALYSQVLTPDERQYLYQSLNKKLGAKDKIEINKLLWKSGAIDLTVELIINLIEHVKTTLLTKYHETPTRTKWMFNLIDITREILIPFREQAITNKWVKYEFDRNKLKYITTKVLSLETKSKLERLNKIL
ncbi:MAG: polyprenyl synthetase family protein [Patescibacteria group bacterium]